MEYKDNAESPTIHLVFKWEDRIVPKFYLRKTFFRGGRSVIPAKRLVRRVQSTNTSHKLQLNTLFCAVDVYL